MQHKNPEYFKKLEYFIDAYTEKEGISPTNKTIAEGTGVSTATVSRYLQQMRKEGRLDYQGHKGIVTRKMKLTKEATELVPLLGNVACGVPKFAEGNIEEYVRLPVSLFGQGNFFLLRASGDSMIDAGISDGDLVLIRQQETADPGQIVVALMEDEATLKRFYPEPKAHRVRLHPENRRMKDIVVENCIIQGIAIKVLKDIV